MHLTEDPLQRALPWFVRPFAPLLTNSEMSSSSASSRPLSSSFAADGFFEGCRGNITEQGRSTTKQ